MSEHQYYEFQAVDRALTDAERRALRALSTRATITSRSFVNTYDWGDFKGDPAKLMEPYFDLHLYFANWGTRHLSVRWPKQAVDVDKIEGFLVGDETATIRAAGEAVILDVTRDEVHDDYWDDESGTLAALAPLRADVIDGDLRLFYLAWLMAVEDGIVEDDAFEPLPGLGPLTEPLVTFARFFCIESDLIEAAAEQAAASAALAISPAAVADFMRALSEEEKHAMLIRVHDGDGVSLHAELRRRVRQALAPSIAIQVRRRTAGELRALSQRRAEERERAAQRKAEAEQRERELVALAVRQRRLAALQTKGDAAWRDVEQAIAERNPAGYDKAVALLADLRELAHTQDRMSQFAGRLAEIRAVHAKKGRFLERLATAALGRLEGSARARRAARRPCS